MRKNKSLVIFAACYLAYTAVYVARLNLSAASVALETLGVLTGAEYGMIAGVFSAVYAVGRLFNGVLSDRFHPAVMISVGLGLTALANFGVGFLPPFIGILLLWALNAYAQSMLWSAILRGVAALYDVTQAKKMTAYLVTTVAVGNIAGILLNAGLIARCGVRYAFFVPGGAALLCGVLILIVMPSVKCAPPRHAAHMPLWRLFADADVRLILLPVFLHGVIKDNISNWMFRYFDAVYAADLSGSAMFALLIPVMGLVGRMIYPACYRLSGEREHSVSACAFLVCALCCLPLLFTPPIAVSALCLGLLYAAASMVNTTALSIFPIRYAETGNVASVSGLMDLAAYLGCAVGAFIYGGVIERYGYLVMYASWGGIALLSAALLIPLLRRERGR